jgi:DNA-binding NarL/FixJ family response regulator
MTESAAAPAALRVLLVDPDDRVRESLAGLLRIGQRCLVVGSAGTADAALRLAQDATPDVVVVDPRLPGVDTGAP